MNRTYTIASILFILYCLLSYSLQAQQQTDHSLHTPAPAHIDHQMPGDHHPFKHHRLSMLMYHSYIYTETLEGNHLLIIPAMGLDYEYWINEVWGFGLHNDVVITHKIEHNMLSGRTYPILTTLDGLWKPYKGLVFLAGPGIEFEEEHQIFFLRGGIEYEIELGRHWDVCPTIFYDNRHNEFNTWSIGLGLGKRF